MSVFVKEPEKRTVSDILEAFDEYCSPKTNETVEPYQIFCVIKLLVNRWNNILWS